MQAMRPKAVFDDEAQRIESKMQPGVRKADIPRLPTRQEQDHAVNSNEFLARHFKGEAEVEARRKELRVTFRRVNTPPTYEARREGRAAREEGLC